MVHPELVARFAQLRAASRAQELPDWALRRDRLRRLRRLLLGEQARFAAAIDADFEGRPAEETALLEVFPALGAIDHALRHGRAWMRTHHHAAGRWFLPARTSLQARPRGVVGIIVPWNYPLYLALAPLVDALAAGNRVMLKPSERAPRFAGAFAAAVAAEFGADEIDVIEGDAALAADFSSLPFDHLFFTGSSATGRKVMRAAAANLVPVTLELGGKSPAILAPDAPLAHAVRRILVGKAVNAGQTCVAPDYVLLPRASLADFIAEAQRAFASLFPDFALTTRTTNLIDARHAAHVHAMHDDALARGAHAHPLADAGPGRRIPLTLLTEVAAESRVLHEEIFGPLLPLVPYDTLDDALAFIAARDDPLACYLFDRDRARSTRILARIRCGGVTRNDTLYHVAQAHLPFGGVGASGIGAAHGAAGFAALSHRLPIFHQSRVSAAGLLDPPWDARVRRWLRLMVR